MKVFVVEANASPQMIALTQALLQNWRVDSTRHRGVIHPFMLQGAR